MIQSFSQLHLGNVFSLEWGSWEGRKLFISASGSKTSCSKLVLKLLLGTQVQSSKDI